MEELFMARRRASIRLIYWAAPFFTQAERIWNRLCAQYLEKCGYTVILPQDEAKKFETSNGLDMEALALDCEKNVLDADLVIAILDGSDADSDTSAKAGIKSIMGGLVLGIRTDSRKAEDGHPNIMFRRLTKVIYFSSFDESHEKLCFIIHKEIKQLPFLEKK